MQIYFSPFSFSVASIALSNKFPKIVVMSIGSGGNFALAAAKALKKHATQVSAKEMAKTAINVAGDIDIFTNHNVIALDFKEED